LADNRDSPRREPGKTPLGRLEKLVGFASAALLWEKFWRAIIPPALVLGLFVSLSFAGLWLNVSRPWRIIGVVLFGLALIMTVLPLFGLRAPSRKQALARIDRSSGVQHNPASGLEDELANDDGDPATRALWAVHRRRMMRAVAALKVGAPSPRMVDFDRYALRAAVLLMLVASAFIAGPEKYARFAAAFDWRETALPGASYRIDAWIDPPAYTGKPPVMLNLTEGASQAQDIAAPINSIVIVRASGGDLSVETQGGLESASKADATKPAQPSTGDREQRWLLQGDSTLCLKHAGALVGLFNIAVIPDLPPQIELTDAPHANARGSLTLSYKVSDDYGVVSAEADFADPTVEGTTGRLRSLVPPPHVALPLPAGPGGLGETQATVDLSDHPWAGAQVKMTLTVHDGGGNWGKSEPIEITLPQRPFVKPIARALVEQRRNLVLFPDSRERVQAALDGLMIAPETFDVSSSVFLGLSVASSMLHDAQSDADLVNVADYLWNMALEIENGSLSEAERDLRAAEQQLRDALQRNAPDEEIRKLTENLRAALDKFLNEFSEQQARELGNQQQPERAPNPSRSISRKDLQSMLDRMQEMARSGDRDDAQRMLEQLQNTLENLQMARRRDADPTTRALNQALRDLDKLTREQQQLRDETNRQARAQEQAQEQRDESDDQQQGQPNEASPQSPNDQGQDQSGQQSPMSEQELHDRQQALRNELEEVEKQLKQMGQDQSDLSEAQKAMKDAENALSQDQNQGQNQGGQDQGGQDQGQGAQGQGQSPGGQDPGGSQGGGNAVEAQGRALEALRKGTEQLAKSMQQGGEGQGAEGDQPGDQEGAGQAEGGGDTDPLGRPLANDPAFDPHARFDPMGMPAAQRAQRVLEELRRRLSDPSRPQEELDYLERLLKPY
jgi:uncharacterized protein (TIGR02302 family)